VDRGSFQTKQGLDSTKHAEKVLCHLAIRPLKGRSGKGTN